LPRSIASGGAPGNRFWILDPVDGTQGFIRGDQYLVAPALVAVGRVELGLLACPELRVTGGSGGPAGVIVAAIRNNGAAVIGLGLADVFTRNPATERSEDKISDQAAGSIAIEQAGGHLTDLIGAPLDFGAARALVRNTASLRRTGMSTRRCWRDSGRQPVIDARP